MFYYPMVTLKGKKYFSDLKYLILESLNLVIFAELSFREGGKIYLLQYSENTCTAHLPS